MNSPLIPFTEQLLEFGEKSGRDSWLSMIVRKELVEIDMLLPEFQTSDCLFTDIGQYLCRATNIIAQLAHRLANGNHIHTYTRLNVNQANEQSELSELGSIDSMISKHSGLKKLVDVLECANRDVTLAWKECTTSPGLERGKTIFRKPIVPFSIDAVPSTVVPSVEIRPSLPREPPIHEQTSTVEATSINITQATGQDTPQETVERLLRDIHRGTGSHHCPYGSECAKGGVSADGTLVMFGRNSAFKAHLEKHVKRYKCNLPGCPNKSGFTRLDLLHRHQLNVSHNHKSPAAEPSGIE